MNLLPDSSVQIPEVRHHDGRTDSRPLPDDAACAGGCRISLQWQWRGCAPDSWRPRGVDHRLCDAAAVGCHEVSQQTHGYRVRVTLRQCITVNDAPILIGDQEGHPQTIAVTHVDITEAGS